MEFVKFVVRQPVNTIIMELAVASVVADFSADPCKATITSFSTANLSIASWTSKHGKIAKNVDLTSVSGLVCGSIGF